MKLIEKSDFPFKALRAIGGMDQIEEKVLVAGRAELREEGGIGLVRPGPEIAANGAFFGLPGPGGTDSPAHGLDGIHAAQMDDLHGAKGHVLRGGGVDGWNVADGVNIEFTPLFLREIGTIRKDAFRHGMQAQMVDAGGDFMVDASPK